MTKEEKSRVCTHIKENIENAQIGDSKIKVYSMENTDNLCKISFSFEKPEPEEKE
jgi:nitrogen regulatory protein PII